MRRLAIADLLVLADADERRARRFALRYGVAMKRTLVVSLCMDARRVPLAAADTAPPFKLGSFERDGRRFVGVVLRDELVIDLAAARRRAAAARVASARSRT